MGGLAVLARSLGFEVSGSDQNVYPPMSTQLEKIGIRMHQGYDDSVLSQAYAQVVVGNVMTRGMPVIETLLESKQRYSSGPRWLGENLLRHKKVFAVAGTHGKTTTSSMLAWLLEYNNHNPGFLIGGVTENFGISARNTDSDNFVIEADEYDSAFFDKRSKFVHYHADVAILNNLEFDHADIFENLDAIKKQFHHFIRTIPNSGTLIVNKDEDNLKTVLDMGCWTPVVTFGTDKTADIYAVPHCSDYSSFALYNNGKMQCSITWDLIGKHNMLNATAAIAAAQSAGVSFEDCARALTDFKGIKRRMERIGSVNSITIYDDFAHHPTAIKTTLEGLRKQVGDDRIIAVVEPRSNTMRMGIHTQSLAESLHLADQAIIFQPEGLDWDLSQLTQYAANIDILTSLDAIISRLTEQTTEPVHIVLMSNGSFGGIYQRLASHFGNTAA